MPRQLFKQRQIMPGEFFRRAFITTYDAVYKLQIGSVCEHLSFVFE